jgi:hypothetical protein
MPKININGKEVEFQKRSKPNIGTQNNNNLNLQ